MPQDENRPFHAQPADQVLQAFDVSPEDGLPEDVVAQRREKWGDNSIRESKRRSLLRILLAQFRSVVVWILSAAAILAFAFAKYTEGVAIVAVILVNCLIGFVSEWRAARSMEALRKMGKRRVRVRRGGSEDEVDAEALVPGDICLHEGGDTVSADLRLVEANSLQVDESALTGESVPAPKREEPVDGDAPLAERSCMLYRGTTITEGSAVGVVTATGMNTELGRVAEMAQEAKESEEETPLERRLNQLGRRLAWVALGAAAVVGATGLVAGKDTLLMIETAIALGVAAVPEGLPFVSTIALARGMWLMARRQALINRLPAVETLGTTNVIFSDKTGTLTENRMVGAALLTPDREYDLREEPDSDRDAANEDGLLRRALEIGVLCNNASLSEDEKGDSETRGDPTEVALLTSGAKYGIQRDDLLDRKPEVREIAFDPDIMMMATVHESDGGYEFQVKGAPTAVLERCESIAGDEPQPMGDDIRREWNEKGRELAGRGLRVLALADKQEQSADAEPYRGLRLVGLIGLLDPPRGDVRDSVHACGRAGIRVIMVTGDQPETARAIAASLDLIEDRNADVLTGSDLGNIDEAGSEQKERILRTRVFARVTPEQKLKLLTLFQENGDTVAMTGDGVNDAPALERADIGVAMGQRGTDAAKESADMVLKNDAFTSIMAAVEQGRVIFSNIRKSVIFMLCTNVAEVAAVGIASVLDWPLPLRPLQILFLNVITDVFPALALSVGKGSPEKVMQRPPRASGESVLGRRQWLTISAWSAVISVCVLGALMLAVETLGFETNRAVTVSFLTLAFAKLWFVLNLREPGTKLWRNDIISNPWMWLALAACVILLVTAVYLPILSDVLTTAPPGLYGWLAILGISAVPMLIGQVRLAFKGG